MVCVCPPLWGGWFCAAKPGEVEIPLPSRLRRATFPKGEGFFVILSGAQRSRRIRKYPKEEKRILRFAQNDTVGKVLSLRGPVGPWQSPGETQYRGKKKFKKFFKWMQ